MFDTFIQVLDDLTASPAASKLTAKEYESFFAVSKSYLHDAGALSAFLNGYRDSLSKGTHRAGKSLRHENGFTKISLWRFRNGCQLRLHLWPEGEFVDSRIHSHRWNLASYIVSGEMTAYNYTLSNEVAHTQHNLFRLYDEKAGVKQIEKSQSATLTESSLYTISRGEAHYLNYTVMHRVRKPAGAPSVSLMLSGVEQSDYSMVSEAEEFKPSPRAFLSPAEIDAALSHHFDF